MALALVCYHLPVRIEGFEGEAARACGCDPWSESCVVPPRGSPGYGCIQSFDSSAGTCGGSPFPNDGHWLQWGFGHGHPLTAGHTEEETKRIASAVFGKGSDITRLLKNEAVRRDARKREGRGEPDDNASRPAPVRATRASSPQPAYARRSLSDNKQQSVRETTEVVSANPVTPHTALPVHLPTQHDLMPAEDHVGGRCRPSVTGIFQVCGPYAAEV